MKEKDGDVDGVSSDLKSCFFSNFPPKECGIATFTKNLSKAMDKKWNPKLKSRIVAINEEGSYYNYNKNVIFEVNKEDIENYIEVAKKINDAENIKILSVQHEFGIFGGDYGNYIIPFLEAIKKPVVVTFHSVLPTPDEKRLKVVRGIASRCAAIIVMANAAIDILEKDYGIDRKKIHLVHHGIPNTPYQNPDNAKKSLKLDGKIVLSTFGLLSVGKGVEYMIKSLPPLIKKYPNLIYFVIGETHPAVRKHEGEKYRNELMALVNELKLQNNVKFYNKYLSYEEIIKYISASDIYIVTNLEKNQIVSGTLIEAMGYGGKAIVATPSTYAKEMLDDGRGIVIKDTHTPKYFTEAIDYLLSNPEERIEMGKAAYSFSRQAIWLNVAFQYLRIFNDVVKLREETTDKFPKIKLNHLIRITDEKGVIQFSNHSTPDISSGYTVDDNARALITTVIHNSLFKSKTAVNLAKRYLNFLEFSQMNDGNFKNNYKNEEEITNPYSDDSFGRAVWALGFTSYNTKIKEIQQKSEQLLKRSLEHISKIDSPRAKASIIFGLSHYHNFVQDKNVFSKIIELADSLVKSYENELSENWEWFEPYLTYSNASIPEALFIAYDLTKNEKYREIAVKTLDFLSNIVFINDELSPIGQNGWYKRSGGRAFFDQQPLDAFSMVSAYITAHKITKEKHYYDKAVLAFNWFLGKNHLKQMIYDENTGGCFDGLGRHSVNLNQGAESTISYLLARLMLEEIKGNSKKIIN